MEWVAGTAADGMRWRREYLRITYGCGAYRPYEGLVREAAVAGGLPGSRADDLTARWHELQPWPEVGTVLGALAGRGLLFGIATNCSVALGARAAQRLGVPVDAVITAEEAGFYKPNPAPYRAVLSRLGTEPARTLFVAGSPADVPGAAWVGMQVFWHNRARLPAIADAPAPLAVADTLHGLLDLV